MTDEERDALLRAILESIVAVRRQVREMWEEASNEVPVE